MCVQHESMQQQCENVLSWARGWLSLRVDRAAMGDVQQSGQNPTVFIDLETLIGATVASHHQLARAAIKRSRLVGPPPAHSPSQFTDRIP